MADRRDSDHRSVTTADGLRIAVRTKGSGPPLVFVRGMNSHVIEMWQEGRNRRYAEALAAGFSVTFYDSRGCGLSDTADDLDIDGLVADLEAVVDDIAEPVSLYGQGWGTPIALAFAARRPAEVTRLMLYAAHARRVPIPRRFVELMRDTPEAATAMMARDSYPDWEAVPANLMRTEALHMSAEVAAAYLQFARTVDVSSELGSITAPTLVMQPEASPPVPFELGREVADAIAGAELVTVPGGAYNPWTDGVDALTLSTIARFTGLTVPANVPRQLTVLATDLVSSTKLALEVGDVRARELQRVHDVVVRDALREHGGTEVKHTGDGILSVFESTTSALEASVAIQAELDRVRRDVPQAGEVRVGLSHGDLFEEEHDIYGTTVVLAVRLADLADPGQILVTGEVRARAEGRVEFGAATAIEAKGFPEPVEAYAVRWERTRTGPAR